MLRKQKNCGKYCSHKPEKCFLFFSEEQEIHILSLQEFLSKLHETQEQRDHIWVKKKRVKPNFWFWKWGLIKSNSLLCYGSNLGSHWNEDIFRIKTWLFFKGQKRSWLIFWSGNRKYWTIGNFTSGIHFIILFSPWNTQY